jgi:hypothetical protein
MTMKKLNAAQIRQGDCLLVRVGDSADVAPADKALVLREGEATGHRHQFMAESRVSFPGRTQLAVGAPAALRHEEHSPATVLPGLYDLPTQVEWTDENEPRVVAD